MSPTERLWAEHVAKQDTREQRRLRRQERQVNVYCDMVASLRHCLSTPINPEHHTEHLRIQATEQAKS